MTGSVFRMVDILIFVGGSHCIRIVPTFILWDCVLHWREENEIVVVVMVMVMVVLVIC